MSKCNLGDVIKPKNWSIFCYLGISYSALLIIDIFLGCINAPNEMLHRSYLSTLFPNNSYLLIFIPLVSLFIILLFSFLLNQVLEKAPLYSAISILAIMFLFSNQYTVLGLVAQALLNLEMSIIIILISINITILENEEPITPESILLLGAIILGLNIIMNSLVIGFSINEFLSIIYFVIAVLGAILIHRQQVLLGALPIFVFSLLNDYVFPMGLNGFDAGTQILKIFSFFLIISYFVRDKFF